MSASRMNVQTNCLCVNNLISIPCPLITQIENVGKIFLDRKAFKWTKET